MNINTSNKQKIVLLACLVVVIFSFWLEAFKSQEIHSDIPLGNSEEVVIKADEGLVGPVLPVSKPVSLRIPDLGIETTFTEPLKLDTTGEIAIPADYDRVGWYGNSPTPGEAGPAIVLGHVDSYEGPAVFFSLGQLKAGDDIYILREDGSEAHFVVDFLERYEQDDFPSSKVYGNINHAGLRLITCSGLYQKEKGRYTKNLVVYAKLVL